MHLELYIIMGKHPLVEGTFPKLYLFFRGEGTSTIQFKDQVINVCWACPPCKLVAIRKALKSKKNGESLSQQGGRVPDWSEDLKK